ncbi:MAG: sulfatase-like hydrolase/transferase [Candidatus Brocadiia bacterium]
MANKNKPNILFILTDDQRFDTIHALGNDEISTPNLDALADEGTTFTHASIMGGTAPAVCMPSRGMIMTGRYLFRLQSRGHTIPPEQKTLPETLKEAGYHTHHVGKWHQDRASFNRCFDSAARIFGFADGWYKTYGGHWNVPLHDYDPSGEYPHENAYILAENKKTKLPVEAGVGGVHSNELFVDAAVDFLDQYQKGDRPATNADKPFFMYLSFVAPHDPRQSPNDYEEMYSSESVRLPGNFMPRHPFDNGELRIRDEALEAWPRRPHAIRRHIADYYALISHLDAQIGRVIDRLKELGEYENTIIVLAGDNGLAVGQHGLMGKQNLYDHSIRVPLIFRGPGVPQNVRSDSLCYLLDVFPTLCDCLGLEVPDSADGTSLMPALNSPGKPLRPSHYYGYCSCQRAVRDSRYKLIEYAADGQRKTQLFDLDEDPWELSNLAEDPKYNEKVAELREQVVEWREMAGDTREEEQSFWDGMDIL